MSLTIAFVGNYSQLLPSMAQVEQAYALISAAVKYGRLQRNFRVFGVRSESEQMLFDAPALFTVLGEQWGRHWAHVITV